MRKLLLILSICVGSQLGAQQLADHSPFFDAGFIWNPAMTAAWDYWELGVNYRQQWTGFEGAPRTASISVQYPFLDENMSMGGFFMNDEVSPITMNNIGFNYAYKLAFGPRGTHQLSIGAQATLSQLYADGLELVVNDQGDPLMPDGENNKISPNAGIGLFYTSISRDEFDESFIFAGLAANQLLPNNLLLDDFGSQANLKRAIHGNATFGARIVEGDLFVQPSLWLNYSMSNILNGTFAVIVEQQDAFWAGINLSTNKTLGIQAGMIVNDEFTKDGNLRIGVMGSYNIGTFGKFRGMGYEAYIAYRFEP